MNVNDINTRIHNYRIAYPMTQKELAAKADVSYQTIHLFENGADIKLSNLIKILNALDLGNNLEMLVPDVTQRPSYQYKKTYLKQRVRKKKKQTGTFKWGEDEC